MEIFDRTTNEFCSMSEEEIAALAQKIINENDGYISVDDFMRILKEEN
jgi:Ca2+-binding EF-hand superfamily protein